MSVKFSLTIDGHSITANEGESIMDAADRAGIYIPRLCDTEGLKPQGSCRVCVVKLNGHTVSSCTQPAQADAVVESEIAEIINYRRDLVRMLFHEGNHLCPICEASGRCELQAMAYRLGITQATKFPYLQPVRPFDSSHPEIMLDTNRCILCGRCIRASRDVDGKNVFEYIGRGVHKRLGVNGVDLAHTNVSLQDKAIDISTCPVGCIIQKGKGFFAPIGQREFDNTQIGARIEQGAEDEKA